MVNYREILRLKKERYSLRQIQASVHSIGQTLSETPERAEELGLTYPPEVSVTNEMLGDILFSDKHTSSGNYPESDFAWIHNELVKSSVTLTLIWDEYRGRAEAMFMRPYMPTQFGDKYRAWA